MRGQPLLLLVLVVGLLAGRTVQAGDQAPDRPNILWITTEDHGPHLGCYGDDYAHTPNIDALAARSLRYDVAWSDAPVCAPARTAIITGVYPTSIGGQHMRSQVDVPEFMHLYPHYLRQAGYYCTNNVKTDYNLPAPRDTWDQSSGQAHYGNRDEGQPFFAIFNITISHESALHRQRDTPHHDPADAPLAAYHPDDPEVRQDYAQYYDSVTRTDVRVGQLLQELEETGLAEDTIIFFYADHGAGLTRNKRWPYNSGLHVPLIVHVPDKYRHLAPDDYQAGGATRRPVGFVDLAPTLLSLIGTEPPQWMQGQAFMGRHEAQPRQYLFGFRGRMDERYDMVRSVRNDRYVYIRNYMPHLIYGQYLEYMFRAPSARAWKRLYDQGKLEPPQTYFWEPKPAEELYDLQTDPDEVHNLVESAEHHQVLDELRQAHRDHVLAIRDVGLLPEAEMHRRAEGTTIYEMARDEDRFPLQRILAEAEIAAARDARAVKQLRQSLDHPDAAVRYWALTGILIRGPEAYQATAGEIRQALADSNPTVRVAAARILVQHGTDQDYQRGLETLAEHARPVQHGAYVAIAALNGLVDQGQRVEHLKPLFAQMETQAPNTPGRANNYVSRLVQFLLDDGD